MFKVVKLAIGAFMTLAAALPAPAFAVGPSQLARSLANQENPEFISASRRTAAPFAHILFCKANPKECSAPRSRWSRLEITLNERHARTLQEVNDLINRQIRPVADNPKLGGGDVWSLAPKSGDCEDYAITKRHELIARGWPARALRLAIAYTAFGEGHMVLVAKTTRGDLVLDNRTETIRAWNKTGLRWVMIQAAGNPTKWMAI